MTDPDKVEGIAITISQAMLKEKGYRNWLRNFLEAMNTEGWCYYMRLGARPRVEVDYVYLVIGNRVRYRAYVGGYGSGHMVFSDGKEMMARVWLILGGPVAKPSAPIAMTGFRGFRYVNKLF